MKYSSVVSGVFRSRPNRFIAVCTINGEDLAVHVKNTGRCRELLIPGAKVWLEPGKPGRKTPYSLIAVEKGGLLINMDSQAPNAVAEEALRDGGLSLPGFETPELVRRETVYRDSRFDFYLESKGKPAFLEVKGVTLEEGGLCSFPDAPTQRGTKHLEGLIQAKEAGMGAFVLFVIQMEGMRAMVPNDKTDPAFGGALRRAEKAGVGILARACRVTPGGLVLAGPVPVFPHGGFPG